jgi:hypothetical protein
MQSTVRPGETVRQMLDYLVWIAQDLQLLGAYAGSQAEHWRRQVGTAYRALVNPMIAGYGDPYPPDVPPPRSPGLWPDVAAHEMPGMTVRHQLAVVGMLADQSRQGVGVRARPEMLQELELRIGRARTALDHGPGRPMPSAARTQASKDLIAAAHAEEQAVRQRARRLARRERGAKPARRAAGAKPPAKAAPKAARPKAPPTARKATPSRAAHAKGTKPAPKRASSPASRGRSARRR